MQGCAAVQDGNQSILFGIKIFEDIEERYNNPTEDMIRRGVEPGSGREKMFEVREVESDISFIRNYLTKDLVMREDMYLFQNKEKTIKSSIKSGQKLEISLLICA